MLCQEESKDVAAEEKAFVLAACVYRSSLLRKSEKPSEEENSELCLFSFTQLLVFCRSGLSKLSSELILGRVHWWVWSCHACLLLEKVRKSTPKVLNFTVTCHVRFLENKQREHRRRHFFPIPGHSVAWSDGEFLCPLCQMLSNTVLPLSSPALCSSQTATPTCDITMDMWRTLINKAIDQGIDGGEAGKIS